MGEVKHCAKHLCLRQAAVEAHVACAEYHLAHDMPIRQPGIRKSHLAHRSHSSGRKRVYCSPQAWGVRLLATYVATAVSKSLVRSRFDIPHQARHPIEAQVGVGVFAQGSALDAVVGGVQIALNVTRALPCTRRKHVRMVPSCTRIQRVPP